MPTDRDPTWQLVLQAAKSMTSRGQTPFGLSALIAEVQALDPDRSRTSIQPIIQGMTINAGTGPASSVGKPLERVGHGLYVLLPQQEPVAPVVESDVSSGRANGVASVPIAVWASVADAMGVMMDAGLGHLLTEDVLRFELIRALIDSGVSPELLRKEVRIDEVGSIDLEVLGEWESAIELKFPREPQGGGAADTMTLGELLRDFFKVAHSGRSNAVVLQFTDNRLRRYLARRTSPEPKWTFEPGNTMNLTPESVVALPKTARASVGPLFERGAVRARCVFAADIGDWKLVAYECTLSSDSLSRVVAHDYLGWQ